MKGQLSAKESGVPLSHAVDAKRGREASVAYGSLRVRLRLDGARETRRHVSCDR